MRDEDFMKRAIDLAFRGKYLAHPNPMVGAVVVKNGKIVAEGYHRRFGGPHAEVVALRKAGPKAKGSTLFVSLEPCSTTGKTPPCVDTILESGIKRVGVACKDPNPKHAGRGIAKLRRRGIRVDLGLCREAAEEQNEIFLNWMRKKRPFVTVKLAMSLDGAIASRTGDSKWISSKQSRKLVHQMRAENDAILTTAQTCIKDRARFNVRLKQKGVREPLKVIIDRKLQLPLRSKVLSVNDPKKVLLVTSGKISGARKQKLERLRKKGVQILLLKFSGEKVPLRELLRFLGKQGIGSVLVEAGGRLVGSLLDARCIDKVAFFYAPLLIGGEKAKRAVLGFGMASVKKSVKLSQVMVKKVDSDYLLTGYPKGSR